MRAHTVTLPRAAQRLALSWHACYRLLLRGQLQGEQVNGRWLLSEESVRRAEAASQSATRSDPVTAA
jgi:hypothetical protein